MGMDLYPAARAVWDSADAHLISAYGDRPCLTPPSLATHWVNSLPLLVADILPNSSLVAANSSRVMTHPFVRLSDTISNARDCVLEIVTFNIEVR